MRESKIVAEMQNEKNAREIPANERSNGVGVIL